MSPGTSRRAGWRAATLQDLVLFQRGYDITKAEQKPGPIPVVSSSGVNSFHAEFKAEGPGVIIGRKGSLGTVHYAKGPYWPHDTTLWSKDLKGNHPRYVYYFLQTLGLERYDVGNSNPTLNRNHIHGLEVLIPDFSIQERICSVLSAYDDLIENNRRRIQLLEQAARLLYKEWFVHLRFPGHEHVKIKDGVPEGWERTPISSFCDVRRGGSPRPIKDFLDGTVPWFKIGDATASETPFVFSTTEKIIEDGVKKSVRLLPGELILSNSATCGIPYFTGVEGCIHDGWLYFKDLTRVSKWFLYCCLFSKQREILSGIGDGATQKNLNTEYIGRQLVLLPKTPRLPDHFDSIVEHLFRQIFTLGQENIRLRGARDLLLPRLMNGEAIP